MYSVSAVPEMGYVAVGCTQCTLGQDGVPAAWSSPDALTWTPAAMQADRSGYAYRVVALEHGLLAIGAGGTDTLTWTSIDGRTWQQGPTLVGSAHQHLSFGKTLAARSGEVVLFLVRGDETVLATGIAQP